LGCVNTFCAPLLFAGEFCSNSAQCYSVNCTNGICIGIQQNQYCSASFENTCDVGLFCQFNGSYNVDNTAQGSCVPKLQAGQSCVAAIGYGQIFPFPISSVIAVCPYAYICEVNSNQCLLPGSLSITSGSTSLPISNPALCAFSNYAYTSINGVPSCVNYCGTGVNDPICLTGYACSCSSNSSGICSPDPCATQKNAIVSCMITNQCSDLYAGPQFQSLIWRSLTNGTCIYDNCQQKVWDYECCLTNFGTRGDLTNGVICSNVPSAPPAPAVASTLSSCFLLLLSVFFFIFVVHL